MHNHDRHPDCLALLPVDSCHWDGCEDGVSALDRLCYHQQPPPQGFVSPGSWTPKPVERTT